MVPQPSHATVAERARQATVANNERAPEDYDRTYANEWRNYCAWIDQMRHQNTIPPGDRYLTRENVDLYFSTVVVDRMVQPTTTRRVVSALQKFADIREYIDGTEKFIVDSISVERSLDTQARLWRDAQKRIVLDPHGNLPTNVLSEPDKISVLNEAMNGSNWKDMTLSFTTCEQTFVRCDSMRKLNLCDLRTMKTHGPDTSGRSPDSLMMSYILRKVIHKERADSIHQVGAWRHQNFLKCSTSMLAFNLFVRLHADADLHFYRNQDPQKNPDWWSRKLIVEWKNRTAAETAYKAVYERAGVSWAKITHIRKLGMEFASSIGELDDRLISNMSKHNKKEKMGRYTTELPRPVMSVMAGFNKKVSSYFLPRSRLPIPNGITLLQVVNLLFPRRNEWLEQSRDEARGDHSQAAKNFLEESLAFLSLVILQDGILRIHHFPHHEASRLLLQVMPAWYPQWAAWARRQCEIMETQRDENAISALNTAAQSAFTSMSRQSSQQYHDLSHQCSQQYHELSRQSSQRYDELSNRVSALESRRTIVEGNGVESNDARIGVTRMPRGESGPGLHGSSREAPCLWHGPSQLATDAAAHHESNVPLPPSIPAFPTALPQSMATLLQQHVAYRLDDFKNVANKKNWPQNIRLAFSKRLYLFGHIEAQARRLRSAEESHENKLRRAAALLDTKRAGKSLPQFMVELKALDPQTKKRNCRDGSALEES